MQYKRMPIEIESPESLGYDSIECNLAESSVRDVLFKDININLNDLVIAYGDHIGKPALRELIAYDHKNISADDVLLTVGAAGALFIINSSLLKKEDHLIVIRPNYATNIETPRAIGCEISFIDLYFEERYELNVDKIKAAIKANTKLISITTPHNPTGTTPGENQLHALVKLAEENSCYLLVDETYRDISFQTPPPLAATLSKNVISISSVSKAYGIPGIRLGWIITQEKSLQHLFLAAKEQIHICNSIVDEEICYQYLIKKEKYTTAIQKEIRTCFTILKNWISNHPHLEWVEPTGGVVCFPRFKKEIKIDIEKFYSVLLEVYKTYIGPGHWFEQSKRSFRLGFGWERTEAFEKGLKNIDKAIADCEG
ncbi:MAG: pyridoxal phosphate-dependent aminotransferase [Bacteroidetes bacterium]|nr:pyridoxal phosphate-dependent aminotransferase [Bacteroidota bacterium]MBS1935217.1 pyridoxal phosphate-dependent aminotransferase [Bacteroidota bacterium]